MAGALLKLNYGNKKQENHKNRLSCFLFPIYSLNKGFANKLEMLKTDKKIAPSFSSAIFD